MNERTPRPGSPTFLIVLIDECDPGGTTVHALTDAMLWAWIQHPEPFPHGVEGLDVPIPGTDLLGYVSRWEPRVDKAQHLVWLPGGQGRAHPALTELSFGPSGTAGFRAAYARLATEIGVDNILEGCW